MKKYILHAVLFFIITNHLHAQNQIKIYETGREFSIRGISIPDPSVIWISGSNGLVGISKDTGISYLFSEIKDSINLDFRDIHAFNDSEALIISTGSPGYIYKTYDGGKNWKQVYVNAAKAIFFDGFDFRDKQHGIAFSDPVNKKFFIVTTHDGGETWQEPDSLSIPECITGEAGFAASGTTITCSKNETVMIASGGSQSRLFISDDFGTHWKAIPTPMISGKETTGIFSICNAPDHERIYIIGGDYKKENLFSDNFFYSDDKGKTWQTGTTQPAGYRSCILPVGINSLICTGSNGSDFSDDRGVTWKKIDGNDFNVAASCISCSFIIFGGKNGKTGLLKKDF